MVFRFGLRWIYLVFDRYLSQGGDLCLENSSYVVSACPLDQAPITNYDWADIARSGGLAATGVFDFSIFKLSFRVLYGVPYVIKGFPCVHYY